MIKLYEIPKGSFILLDEELITFHHVDGMYSYCTDTKGNPVHLSAVTPLKKVGDHYEIDDEEKN